MKIIERVLYGKRGEGCLVRYEGVATWFSVYCQNGKERRRTTAKSDLKAAKKITRDFSMPSLRAPRPQAAASADGARVTVSELLDELEADFRLRGVKCGPRRSTTRPWFDVVRRCEGGQAHLGDVDRYIEARLAEDYAPASVNRKRACWGRRCAWRIGAAR